MACSKQHGVRTYLDFVERFTGETITQSEWHRIRQLTADSEAGEENTSAKLSRRRVTEREATAASMNIADSVYKDMGFDSTEGDSALLLAQASSVMKEQARSANVSYGTYAAINYLAENGVSKTLEKIRNEKKPNIVEPNSLESLYNYEVWRISSEDGPRSVAAFHELERRALPDLEELRSSYSQYPDNALEQPTFLMDKLAPAMREFERLESDKETPKVELEKLASLVSDAAEDANYHTFNSWFMERSRKNGLDIESGGELRRIDELAEIAEAESGSSKSGAVNHGVGWDEDYWNAVTR